MIGNDHSLLSGARARNRYISLWIVLLIGFSLTPGVPRADPAVLLPVPNVRQYTAYACGAATLQAILDSLTDRFMLQMGQDLRFERKLPLSPKRVSRRQWCTKRVGLSGAALVTHNQTVSAL